MSDGDRVVNPALTYMPQLDGLRGVGVIVVLLHHYATITLKATHQVGLATMGLFFTMSSYLITSILLRSRALADRHEITRQAAWKHYFVRRAVRIFPAYFLVLALAYITDVGEMRRDIAWHATYLSNVLFRDPAIMTSSIHLWSLAVEEQFYLVWPLLILLCPRRVLPWAMGALAFGSVGHRIAVTQASRLAEYGTLAQADYLAFGGLYALLEAALAARPELRRIWDRVPAASLAFAVSLLALRYSGLFTSHDVLAHLVRGSHCGSAMFLVSGAARGFRGPLGWLLEHPIALRLGEASYSAYLIHMYMGPWVAPYLLSFGIVLASKDWLLVVVLVPLSLAWALASYRFFERPLMRMRMRMRTRAPVRGPA